MLNPEKLIEAYRKMLIEYEVKAQEMEKTPEYFENSIRRYKKHITNIRKEIELLERGDIKGYREYRKRVSEGRQKNDTKV